MKIVAVQFAIAWEDKPANFGRVRALLAAAAPARGSLIVLPEMFATGFSMNAAVIAEGYGGLTEQFLAGLARDFGAFVLAGAALRGRDGQPRNKALVYSPEGRLAGFYAKMRPFTPGGEKDHYAAGQHPLCLDLGECRLSPFVCYDLRFPELFRQAAAAARPQLFAVIANWPEKRAGHWARLLQARAIENQAFVVGVNRVGTDPYYTYCGRSLILDFNGEVLADAGGGESVIQAEVDLAQLAQYRAGLPFLDDLAGFGPHVSPQKP